MALTARSIERSSFLGQSVRNFNEIARCQTAINQGGKTAMVALPGNVGMINAAVRLEQLVTTTRLQQLGATTARAAKIELPEMIDMGSYRIMKTEVTVDLFKQMIGAYKPEGNNADALSAILTDPARESDALTYVNLLDAREFARRLSDLTGRKFRVQTEGEWVQARDKLSGKNWTWTETEFNDQTFVLRHLLRTERVNLPDRRINGNAVRLVEDK